MLTLNLDQMHILTDINGHSWIISIFSISSASNRQSPCTAPPPDDDEKEANLPSQPPQSHRKDSRTIQALSEILEKAHPALSGGSPPPSIPFLPRTPTLVALPQKAPQEKDLEAQFSPERQKLRHSRLSGLIELRGSPKSFESREGSETSDFSTLVFGIRKSPSSASKRCTTRNMGEMSIAKLTSGVAGGGWRSR